MDRWELIEHAYHGARDLSGAERARFLDRECGSDAAIRRQVEALLAQDDSPDSLLNQPVVDGAAGWAGSLGPRTSLIGRSIGPYHVLEHLGSGGMGEVYRARDPKLNRDVALKVLPPIFALDVERLARFKREAQVLASLNHPNIGAIYGFEESADVRALVLELVDGPTLGDRLARGPMSIDDALAAARQIADAIAAAHERGVVHRDLKPANIKLRSDGVLKVLDFGLAKLVEPVAAETDPSATARPTITSPATAIGAGGLLGTPAYMSPEQVKGRPADARSDVWGFGCVLYEMITGRRAFVGDDVSDTLAAVLRAEPEWAALPADTPPTLRTVLEGCLRKDRRACIGDIGTVRFLLNEQRLASSVPSSTLTAARWSNRGVAIAAIVLTIAGAGVIGIMSASRQEAPRPVVRFSMPLGDGVKLSNPGRRQVAISADGTQVIFAANRQLFVRSFSDSEARPIAGTLDTGSVTNPAFSPDGRFVAFWSGTERALKRVAITGGSAVTICHANNPFGVSWSADDILFGEGPEDAASLNRIGIKRVRATGGEPELLVKVKQDERAADPEMLPGSAGVLFTLASGFKTLEGNNARPWDQARIVVYTSKDEPPRILFQGGRAAHYLPTGHIVYAVGDNLFASSFDLAHLRPTGASIPILGGVGRTTETGGPAAQYSVSRNGSLIYFPATLNLVTRFNLAFLDPGGETQPLKLPANRYESPRVSPDSKQLAFVINDDRGADVWVYDLSGNNEPRRLTSGGRNRLPVWSADSRYVVFQSDREGDLAIFWQRSDGSAPPERLTTPEPGTSHFPESWSPTGDVLSFSAEKGNRYTLRLRSLREKRDVSFGDVESGLPAASEFSPDGGWIAYQKGEPRAPDPLANTAVFVQAVQQTGPAIQISSGDVGYRPMWSTDGKELFYALQSKGPSPPRWVAVPIDLQPNVRWGAPRPVPAGDLTTTGPNGAATRDYALAPDGRRIGVVRAQAPEKSQPVPDFIQVVLNFSEELKQRVPAK
jgi:serine/threonine-protein kinase